MRVLHVVGRSHGRGAELTALELARALDARGHHDAVLACNVAFDGSIDPRLPVLSRRARMDPLALLGVARRLRRHVAQGGYDIVLAHGGWAASAAAIARARSWPPLVWQRILGFPPGFWQSARRRWWRMVAARMDAAVVLTPEMRHEMTRLGFARPTWLIPNFRDPRRFAGLDRDAEADRLRAALGVDTASALVGLVGHLIEQKRPERALDVLAELQRLGMDAHLVVAGDGPLRAPLAAAARARNLESRVHLLGHRDDAERVLAGVDLLLLTSDDEGIPGILIEARMAGCPVVTYPFAGAHQVVDHGETGIVLERPDPRDAAAAAAALLARRDELHRMSAIARATADRFSLDGAAARYEHLLAGLAASRPLTSR